MIERKDYMERLVGYRDKQVIKIITGIRRCGKSTLLALFQQYLIDSGVAPDNIIMVNFEDYDNRSLCDPGALHDYVSFPGALEFAGNQKHILGYLQGVYDNEL